MNMNTNPDPATPAPAPAPAPATPPLIPSIWHTIRTNGRDLLIFAIMGLGLAVFGGVVDYVAQFFGGNRFLALALPTLSNYAQGFSRFIGSSLCATLVFMILWPTVAHFGNHSFKEGWDSLTVRERFFTYIGTIMVALIAAAHCFSSR